MGGLLTLMTLCIGTLGGDALYEYDEIWKAEIGSQSVAVPEAGLTWTWDCATFQLQAGSLRSARSIEGWSPITRFDGEGQVDITIDDPIERRHYETMTQSHLAGKSLRLEFEQMILFQSDPFFPELFDHDSDGGFQKDRDVEDRLRDILQSNFQDMAADLVCARHIPGGLYRGAWINTTQHGWLLVDQDVLRSEEIAMTKINRSVAADNYPEMWLSLDSDRGEDGRPRSVYRFMFAMPDFDIQVDIKGTGAGLQQKSEFDTQFKVVATVRSLQDDLGILPLTLEPDAKVNAIFDEKKQPLKFVRRHIGKDFASVDNDLYDSELLVILNEPLAKGQETRIEFNYDIEIRNYASGRRWYPARAEESLLDMHTAKMHFTVGKKYEVRASGSLLDDQQTWAVTEPTKMLGFSFGRKFKEEELAMEGLPTVTVFGVRDSIGTGNQLRNVGVDIINSLNFYKWLFKVEIPSEHIWATRIEAFHGQSFEGYVHLSGITFNSESPGASELFRAHETAHQYWGHMVGWRSYRDQWLSESLAEYSAMMFIEGTMTKHDYFHEILDAYSKSIFGKLSGSKFWKFGEARWPSHLRLRIGAIGMGHRASNADTPIGYQMQVYTKGPLVVHMMRMLVENLTGDAYGFHRVLGDFVRGGTGKTATTEDFQRMLEAHTQMDWSRFFDQWIYSVHIPTLKCREEINPSSEGYQVTLEVQQSDVPSDFETLLPVEFEYDDKTRSRILMRVVGVSASQEITLAKKPKKVIFNPNYSVLADMK